MSFIQMLRHATAADHQAVDDRYGGFRLDDVGDYRSFLQAHARALPAVEAVLLGDTTLPTWRPRTGLLVDDLAAMAGAAPQPLAFQAWTPAARWGALYVIEGSRLGGQLLARRVPAGLPSAYLSARHLPGEWRALLAAVEAQGATESDAWRAAAVEGARACFALYGAAAVAPNEASG